VFFAHSATTLLLMIGSTGAIFAHAYVWQPASRIPMARTFLIVFLMVLTLLAATIAFGFMQLDAEKTLLNALGKDSTLTGRTFLWQIAHRVIDQHPWTGVGAVGFWRPEFGAANEITRYFDYENFTKFSFHNSYLENGVQFGYPGYYATYLLVAWGVWSAFRVWTRNQTLYNAVFMILALMVLIRSNAEVDLAGELAPTAILMFIGGIRRDPKGKPHPAFGELVSTMAQPPAPPPPPPPVEQPRGRFYPRPAPYRR
ncbi:MAG TPA: O-antigen ligase family protein, partial [Hyphomonadaceae bacterium]|nr:O-antigen ligase family protein [Hyphomonadaceae bacterium]